MSAGQQLETKPVGLRLHNVAKTFPGVQALRGIDLEVEHGTVHALIGHNGSGKSTLVKILAGVHPPDPGAEAWIDGRPFQLGSAEAAANEGIRFVHQELGIVQELSALDNVGLVLGFERGRLGTIAWNRQARTTAALLDRFGVAIDLHLPLAAASPVARTALAIVRAVAGWEHGRGLLVLDEPTAALPAHEVDELFRLVREIRDSGAAVLFISHRLDEVLAIAERATVLRDGQVLWDGQTADASIKTLASLVGGESHTDLPAQSSPAPAADDRDLILEVTGLEGVYLRGIDIRVRRGEIVGVAGLLGSGREEFPYILAGALPAFGGCFAVEGTTLHDPTILRTRAAGIAFVPADRAQEGIIAEFNVRENASLGALPSMRSGPMLSPRRERRFVGRWLSSVNASPTVMERPIMTLSGGNQQKVVLARWLATEPKLLLLSEPTAGVDVGAKHALYRELQSRAEAGLAILLCSSDLEDLTSVCSRVVVLRDGRLVASYVGTGINKTAIISAMEGAHGD